ncbi:MAG: putative S-adenosylmethionine:tRNA ribosyltransferase-isomerase [Actinomycetia bacterium]|nr:putative S-adenosylmethionine:tRNA ribosyltransferase-isomerase [Actinomycetes bacterium]
MTSAPTVRPEPRPGATHSRLSFHLPPHLEAGSPPEARGMTRDAVRMMVAHRSTGAIVNSTFALLPAFLDPGDLVVINTSGTIPAAVRATTPEGEAVVVHLSTRLDGNRWVVEPRRAVGDHSERWTGDPPGRHLDLGPDASMDLVERYLDSPRLWVADLALPDPVLTWLTVHGKPIRYGYVEQPWPLAAYQNVYVTEPGSAEMPSAGRPFTPEVVTRLVAKGVGVTPLVLHTGVASLESTELPYPEHVRVPASTAARVNATRAAGGRVVAVGTTVVRGLETAADDSGHVRAFDGWTDLVITPERGVHAVDGLLTGWHEPEASHLLMLEAVAGRELLEASYAESLREGYQWHEFGDVHLLLP